MYREISWSGDYFRGWLRFFAGGKGASSYKLVLENGELFKCCCDEECTFFLEFRITDYRHCLLISLQSWLSHEVEVLVSVGQARQTLENLIDDRKVLSRQLAELRSQEQDEDDEPAVKVLTVCSSLCLCVCLSVSLSICLSVFLSVCPSLCLSVCLFIWVRFLVPFLLEYCLTDSSKDTSSNQ